MRPVLTDRYGFLLSPGNTVVKLGDMSTFTVSQAMTSGTSPVIHLLNDGKGGFVDASTVMVIEEERGKRATFCEVCFNHYTSGVTWFKSPFEHPKGSCVYSACVGCLSEVEYSTLPEVDWVA